MKSSIAAAVKLSSQPVAIIQTDSFPEGALQFKPDQRACVVAFLAAASRGKLAACSEDTTPCPGGKAGLGFCPIPEHVKYFLSTGSADADGERYKKTPELAQQYMDGMDRIEPAKYIVFKPYELVTEEDRPSSVVFLVNADQLSGLITLANFDRPTQDNVKIRFGAGCAQSVLYALKDQEDGSSCCTVGLTDPSSRAVIDGDLLSFSIPYDRFLQMEENVEESFLTKSAWEQIAKRI